MNAQYSHVRRWPAARLPVYLLILVWLVSLAPGHAAFWYVDNTATGARNGTSWSNAWASFSAIVWGGSGVKAGDTLFISGGSTSKIYTETWSVQASGTATSPITIAVDAGNPAHNGIVIFDYDQFGDTATVNGISIGGSYITFTGNVNGANHIQMNNLRNIMASFTSACLAGNGRTGVTFDHLEFNNDNTPIKLLSSTGTTVRNCRFLGVRGNAAAALGNSSGTWDASRVYSNYVELVVNTATPPGATEAYLGPDGIETGAGVSIYHNIFKAVAGSVYTSTEHTDFVQAYGNYIKIYNNEFINVGDSAIDIGRVAVNSDVSHIWIYNNLFRIEQTIDTGPEFIRIYTGLTSNNTITNLADIKIVNNNFIDNTRYVPIRINQFHANPTASANVIANNIFYSTSGSSPVLLIDPSSNFGSNSFTFDANVYYRSGSAPTVSFNGTTYSVANWIANFDLHGKTTAPAFVAYTAFGTGNDFHLRATDTVAKDAGLDLSSYFNFDRDNVSRPQGPAWDIGAYEFASGPGPAPRLTLNRIAPNSLKISWPSAATSYRLQRNTNLSAGNWTDVTTTPTTDGTNQSVTITTTGAGAFYRLIKP